MPQDPTPPASRGHGKELSLLPTLCRRLTAFVLKSFAQARSHIFIEEKHIQDALAWLAGKQKDNGCFRSSGTLLNNAIKVTYLPSRLPMGLMGPIQDSSDTERACNSSWEQLSHCCTWGWGR